MDMTLIMLVIAAVFVGALSRATFGFGEAVVSMPLLALLPIDLHTSISLIGLAGLTVASFTVISGWQYIDRPALICLVIGALIGIPAGLVLVIKLPASIVTLALGIFLILYGSYSFLRFYLSTNEVKSRLNANFWAFPVGIISGIMGSAYNSHGVPVVVYGTLRRWEPRRFRGTLQAHFLNFRIIYRSWTSAWWIMDTGFVSFVCMVLACYCYSNFIGCIFAQPNSKGKI